MAIQHKKCKSVIEAYKDDLAVDQLQVVKDALKQTRTEFDEFLKIDVISLGSAGDAIVGRVNSLFDDLEDALAVLVPNGISGKDALINRVSQAVNAHHNTIIDKFIAGFKAAGIDLIHQPNTSNTDDFFKFEFEDKSHTFNVLDMQHDQNGQGFKAELDGSIIHDYHSNYAGPHTGFNSEVIDTVLIALDYLK